MERKRKALSLETKYEIINEFEKSGKSKIEIAKQQIFAVHQLALISDNPMFGNKVPYKG